MPCSICKDIGHNMRTHHLYANSTKDISVRYNDGQLYQGITRATKHNQHGYGILYYKNGNKHYEGWWKKGKKHGKGILYYENGLKQYEGGWKNDKRNGHGIEYFTYRTYSGKCHKYYEGEWQDDKRHGHGIRYMLDGSSKFYEGEWQDNNICGHGIEYDSDGNKRYEGEWDVVKNGNGILYYKGKIKYRGNWKNGRRHGQGIEYNVNDKILYYIGGWKEDKRNGRGVIYTFDRNKINEFWENGKCSNLEYLFNSSQPKLPTGGFKSKISLFNKST